MPETVESTAFRFANKFKKLHNCSASVREGFRIGFLQGAQHQVDRLNDIAMLARRNKLSGDWAHVHRLCMELGATPPQTMRRDDDHESE